MKQEEKKTMRQSNFELMRVVSMIMIVIFHVLLDGNLLQNTTGNLHLLLELVCFFIVVHVNSFMLLTGYFQYDKKFKLKKVLNLLNASWFYRVVWIVIFICIGLPSLTGLKVFMEVFPVDITFDFWFINAYILVYVLSPFSNMLIEKMSQKQHRRLLILLFFILCVLPFLTNRGTFHNDGVFVHYMFLYFIGSYLHKYPVKNNMHFRYFSASKKRLIFFTGMFLCFLLNYTNTLFATNLAYNSNSILHWIGDSIGGYRYMYWNPFILIQSICYFLFFETFEFKNKWINSISPYIRCLFVTCL